MRPIIFFCLFLAACAPARGGLAAAAPDIPAERVKLIVDAIYRIEGGAKARKPFGILSVPCDGYHDCRRVAENTVRNNYRRWLATEGRRRGDFLEFLAARYCPRSADPIGHRNWIKNIQSIVK